jgi:hypothetical protein
VLAACARIAPVDLAHRPAAALIGLVVEVDRQHGRIAANPDLAAIGLVDLERAFVDDVLPAMVLEIARHACLPFVASRHSYRTLRPKS